MEEWEGESPSEEDDRNEIENELYSMFYYHSMSDGLPQDLAQKYDIDNNDFGVTISLKCNDNSTSEKNLAPVLNDSQCLDEDDGLTGMFTIKQQKRDNNRFINGINKSDVLMKKLSCSSETDRNFIIDVEKPSDSPLQTFPPLILQRNFSKSIRVPNLKENVSRASCTSEKKRLNPTERIINSQVSSPHNKSVHNNLSDDLSDFIKLPSSTPNNNKESGKYVINRLQSRNTNKDFGKYVINRLQSRNTNEVNNRSRTGEKKISVTPDVVDLTLNLVDQHCVTPRKIGKKLTRKKNNSPIITISSGSEESDLSSDHSESCFERSSDSILLNSFSTINYDDSEMQINIDYNWKQTSSPEGWTKAMQKFYNKPSKKLHNFDYRNILREIRKCGGGDWSVSKADMSGKRNYRRIRCARCHQEGHVVSRCTKIFNCHMCGTPGHKSTKCPHKICLRCGSKHQDDFVAGCVNCMYEKKTVCSLCGLKGHPAHLCTNAWRNFHSGNMDDENERTGPKYCCNCAKKGHTYEDCWTKFSHHSSFHAVYNEMNPGRDAVRRKVNKRYRRFSDSNANESHVIQRINKTRFRIHPKALKNRKCFKARNSGEKLKRQTTPKRQKLKKSNKKNKCRYHLSSTI